MQRASPQILASAIWKSTLLFLLFMQSYYNVKVNLCMLFVIFCIVHMLHYLLCITEFEKNKLFDFF